MISPASRRCMASGLTRTSVRSRAIEGRTLLRRFGGGLLLLRRRRFGRRGAAAARTRRRRGRELDRRRRRHARLAIRADLPERLERLLARLAGLLELGRADRAHEEALLHCGAA